VAHDVTAATVIEDPGSGVTSLVARVSAGRATERSKALSEGWIGGLSLSLLGSDLIADRGANAAATATGIAGAYSMAGFGAVSGGSLRYDTGSHVDMNSLSLMVGLAFRADLSPGRLVLGAFFEYGNGSYDTHNSFSSAASVDGDGDAYYIGGGALGRLDFTNSGPGHFYAEASIRAGGVHNEYNSSDLRGVSGLSTEYDSSSAYYGFHLGSGYVVSLESGVSIDFYGKYFFTRQEGDSVTLSTGERVRFKDADSSRLRLGGRLAYAVNERFSPYVGLAWEREFDGAAAATTNGLSIKAPSLRGNTGVGELGLTFKPSAGSPWSFDLSVQGYVGKREGVTGNLMVKFEF
jgi:outer membrane autotransporter protein